MNTIEVILKGSPLALSIQRKEVQEAEAVYQKILQAMGSKNPQAIELTCDRELDKRIAVLSSEISAIQMSEKSTPTSGRPGAFLGLS